MQLIAKLNTLLKIDVERIASHYSNFLFVEIRNDENHITFEYILDPESERDQVLLFEGNKEIGFIAITTEYTPRELFLLLSKLPSNLFEPLANALVGTVLEIPILQPKMPLNLLLLMQQNLKPDLKQIKFLLQEIDTMVENHLKTAHLNNKKLLLIAGEGHTNQYSLLLQMIFLLAVKKHKINNVLTETDQTLLDTILTAPREQKFINAEYSFLFAHYRLRLNLLTNDLAASDDSIIREQEMVRFCIQNHENALFILGAVHLRGLMNSEELGQPYHVVGINISGMNRNTLFHQISMTNDIEKIKSLFFILNSPSLLNINLIGNPSLLSIEEIHSYVDELTKSYLQSNEEHGDFNSPEQESSLQFSPMRFFNDVKKESSTPAVLASPTT